jgi:hypothetical protein
MTGTGGAISIKVPVQYSVKLILVLTFLGWRASRFTPAHSPPPLSPSPPHPAATLPPPKG